MLIQKLLLYTQRVDGRVLALVSPFLVLGSNPISHVDDVYNGILVDTNMLGRALFYGAGAGKLPTASAVVADIIDIVAHMGQDNVRAPKFTVAADSDYASFEDYACRSCFSFVNEAGAKEKIEAAFGDVATVTVGDRIALIAAKMTEKEAEAKAKTTGLTLAARIRVLG